MRKFLLFVSFVVLSLSSFAQLPNATFNSTAFGRLPGNSASVSNNGLTGTITYASGLYTWTVPTTGKYEFIVAGAGNSVAKGAIVKGKVNLTAGTQLIILAGQKAASGTGNSAGGNGGSFVAVNNINTPFIVAGGAGGINSNSPNNTTQGYINGSTNTSGNNGNTGFGGTNGSGGQANTNNTSYGGGGGGGFLTNGVNTSSYGQPGFSFVNGGNGGVSSGSANQIGGFGGGATGNSNDEPGGGGGYSGGGGGGFNGSSNVTGSTRHAGGGGSFIHQDFYSISTSNGSYAGQTTFGGIAITNLAQYNTSSGYITITQLFEGGEISFNGNGDVSLPLCPSQFPYDLSTTVSNNIADGGDGNFTYSWQYSSVQDFSSDVTTLNSNTLTYDFGAFDQTTYIRRKVLDGNGLIAYSNTLKLEKLINPTISVQPSNTPQQVCLNVSPTRLTVAATGTGLTYQWYSNNSNSNSSGTIINAANSSTYTPSTNSAGTTYFYVVLSGTCGTLTSTVTQVDVAAASTAGTISANSTTVCYGSLVEITLNGSNGSVQWQSSANNSTWGNITSANSSIYSTTSLSESKYFRAIVTFGTCTSATSGTISVTVPARPYPYDRAINFSNGGQLSAASSSTLNLSGTNNFTVEAWIYPTSFANASAGIVSKSNSFSLKTEGSGVLSFLIENGWSWERLATSNNALVLNKWQHVSATYNGTSKVMKLYIDGVDVGTYTRNQNFNPDFTTGNLQIGTNISGNGGSQRQFNGSIDEVRLWNVVKTNAEISTSSNLGYELSSNAANLMAYYKFDEGIGGGTNTGRTSFADNSINSNNLSISGMTLNGSTNNIVQAGPTILTTPSLCLNGTATLTHTISGGTWSTSDANIISIDQATSIATAVAAGSVTITYTFTDNGCTYTSTKLFTVNALPAAPSATTPVNYCQNVTATALTATALAGNTLQWYTVANAGTATTTAFTPSTSAVGSTLYYVSQKNNTTGCEGPRTAITVAVATVPVVTASSNSFCSGTPVALTLTGHNGNVQWQSSSNNSTWTNLTGATSDTYTVTNLTATTYFRTSVSGGTCSTTSNVSTISLAKAAGDFGSALNFDGSDDVITVPNNAALNISGNISVEAWIKPATGGTNIQNVISKSTSSGVGSNTGYIFPRTDDNWANFSGYLHIGNAWRSISHPYPTDGLFHHLAMTYDGSNIRLYLDGNLVKTQVQTGTIATNTNSLALGNQPGFSELFIGTLDEARIWNAALSADQIKSRMNSELAGTETNLVLNYNFNQGVPGGSNTSVVSESNVASTSLVGTLTNFAKTGATSNYVSSAVVNPIGGSTLCIGSPLQLTHPNSGGTWSIPATTGLSISNTGALTGTLSTTATSVVVSYDYTINACSFTSTKTINISELIAGTATGNQTLCSSSTTLTAITLAGNTSGSSIQWQSSLDNVTFSNISNATSASLSPASVTATTYYRAAVTTATCGTLNSNVIIKGYNNSLHFDGTDDFVQAGAPLPIAANDNFTYEAWVRPTVIDSYRGFLGTHVPNGGRGPSMWVGPNGSLHTDSYSGSTRFDMVVDDFFAANAWVHVAWVKNGTTYTVYKNGVQVSTRTAPSSVLLPNANFTIGKLDNWFAGTLDEVRIWNTARTAQEITDNMSATLNGNETGLRAYYTFNQGIPGGSNSSINTVANLTSTPNLNGTLTAFAKSGNTSNFIDGFRVLLTQQPTAPTAVCLNASSNTISVTALGSGLTYQWFTNTVNNTTNATAIANATTNSYTIPTNVAGTRFYYVVVTGSCSSSITSNIVSQVVNTSTFTTQPSSSAQNLAFGGTATALTVASPGATAYQWFSNSNNSTSGGTAITGATSATYTPSTATPGALYYYAVATGGCSTATSSLSGLITVGKATPTIGSMTAINKTFGDAAFTLTAPTSNATGAFTFASSNTAVATISGTTVTIVGAGTATITATQATDANYNAGSVSTTLTVAKATPTIGSMTAINKTFGDAAFTLTAPTSNATGAFTYASSNTAVAAITNNTVTIVGAGTITITATQATSANYLAGSVTTTLTVAKANPTIGTQQNITRAFGSSAITLVAPSSNSAGAFTYTINDASVATISGATLSPVGIGTATITATQAATANYNAGSITRTITVVKGTPTIGSFAAINKTFGDAAFTLTAPSSTSTGAFTYASSDASVATVSGSTVTIVGAGTANITATQAEDANYNTGSVSAVLTVGKAARTLSLFADINKTTTDAPFTLTAPISSAGTGAITYSSSNSGVATVSGSTVTLVGIGTTTITATQAADANYLAATITATLTVILGDSDGDGVPDDVEVREGTDPNNPSSVKDSDGDGVPDFVEIGNGTNPNSPSDAIDSDGDGLSDYYEARNTAPTNITLSTAIVNENNVAGAGIINLTATDANIGEAFTYTLVAGTGDTDNASFRINGSSLQAVASFDFETKTSYSFRLRVTDKGGLSFEKEFTITVINVNEAPTALALSNTSVLENAASGTILGTLAGTDADAGDMHTYTLVAGTGSTDNASFTITGTTLSTAAVFNFEAKNSYAVRVRVTDAGGLSFERAFTITVTDVNEAPTLTAITDRRVYNVSTSQVVNLAGITAGPETAQTTTTSVSTSNPTVFSAINIVGTQIQFTLAAGIATPQDVVVTVRVRDNGGVANGGVDSVVRTFRLGIDPMPVAAASPNLITLGATAQLSAAGANAVNYTWVAVGGTGIVGSGATINVRPAGTTTYAVVVTNSFGYQATVPVLLTVIVDYKLVPNNLVTPNGDGVNDRWVIPNIDMYPDNEVMVYDKAGRVVFSKRGYNNEWDGTVNGTKLKEDAYYYVIKFNKDGALPIRGYVSIVR
jgi:gliding motility-associated-like protein